MNNSYEIWTDTAADFPWDAIKECELHQLPMPMLLNGVPFEYGGKMHPGDLCRYYRELAAGASSTTAQIAPAIYQEAFAQAFSRGHDVLYIGFSSGMSGSMQNAVSAASSVMEAATSHKVICVDSLGATVSQGLLVLCALANQRYGLSLEINANWLNGAKGQIHMCFSVEDINYLLRGGRINRNQAFWSKALHIHPLMHIDPKGTLHMLAKVRGDKGILRAMVEQSMSVCEDQEHPILMIGHSDALNRAGQLARLVQEHLPTADVTILPMNPVIGCHTGPNTVLLAYCESGTRERIARLMIEKGK